MSTGRDLVILFVLQELFSRDLVISQIQLPRRVYVIWADMKEETEVVEYRAEIIVFIAYKLLFSENFSVHFSFTVFSFLV